MVLSPSKVKQEMNIFTLFIFELENAFFAEAILTQKYILYVKAILKSNQL